ncbi:hypothetical protein EJB05_01056, partial [Eragrostis curvula]
MARKKTMASAAHELLTALLEAGTAALRPAVRRPDNRSVHRRGVPPAARLAGATLVVDVDGALLRSGSLFPYFMLVALEAGGFLRGLALLLLYPAVACLLALGGAGADLAVRAMAAAAFCGLRAGTFRAGRAVLPRWLLEDVAAEALRVANGAAAAAAPAAKRVVWASAMPRVMVEPFLREYLLQAPPAAAVAAPEMRTAWGFYTGIMAEAKVVSELRKKNKTAAGDGDDDVVGFSAGDSSMAFLRSPLASMCKEVYVASEEERSKWRPLPRRALPRPLVFHDGRLAFLPTPLAAAAMFTWLPFGAFLAVLRLAASLALPYRYATLLHAATGMSWRLRGSPPPPPPPLAGGGQLYACNHRTLIDPVYVSMALDRRVRAVSYSLSRVSDLISPIGATVRLARDRARDGAAMAKLLAGGAAVVVCPEGTTCREPYLLRFSPLFAELASGSGGVVPVALAAETAMFYGTTAGGWKAVDPFYYLANPRMCYTVEFLDRVDAAAAAAASPGKEEEEEGKVKAPAMTSVDVANSVQRMIAAALGYECTMLTRKDKYLMLAGNDGNK